jgi:hypothetical protein
MKNKFLLSVISYLVIALTLYLTSMFNQFFQNEILTYLLAPLPLWFLIYFILTYKNTTPKPLQEQSIRYTMHCKNCNWEWMSHTSEKKPTQCPNCKDRNKLEIIGWRKISFPKRRGEQTLKKFI